MTTTISDSVSTADRLTDVAPSVSVAAAAPIAPAAVRGPNGLQLSEPKTRR